ncbi:Cof-type HAD-IIB family hydrolase [Humisphaera borealis]|uniref:HAD family phosphatase n=1 Tax=Humisphaera borealis TaxID=2807512 RepID=A0A7M2X0X9_9BACT|nr:Cof-type HAD-IIB family hydrolase [Humisphaera borealis]QOV91397.1 HAD family phosphatase [Humisphaera borealis]
MSRVPKQPRSIAPAQIPPIGLVAIDLDGTLLTDQKQVSKRTARALAALPSRGVKVVIASARPPRSVKPIYELLGLDTWQINYNGALIWDHPNLQIVHHQPMPPALVNAIVQHARGAYPDCLVSCEILDKWFTDRYDNTYTTETGRMFEPDLVAPLWMFLSQPVTKLMLLGPTTMIDDLTQLVREAFPQVAVVRSDPELLQIMDASASKAAALNYVGEAYGVPMSRVMAIGDAMNDLEMLQAAGVAVAMDNAPPAIKQVSHWVAPSNNDHGVHAALVRYGLVD